MNQKQLSMEMMELELLRNPVVAKLLAVIGHAGIDNMTGGSGNVIDASQDDKVTDILRGSSGNDTFKCFTHLLDHAVDYKAGKRFYYW